MAEGVARRERPAADERGASRRKSSSAASRSIRDLYEKGEAGAFIPFATALRYGRGTAADPVKARALLEEAVANDNARALVMLAEMLAEGEGGPADGKRAIALLTEPARRSRRPIRPGRRSPRLYLDNRYTGRRPREALRLLAGSSDIDARIRAAGLFMDYDEKLEYPTSYIATMDAATKVGEPGAAMAWARLKLSGPSAVRQQGRRGARDPCDARRRRRSRGADHDRRDPVRRPRRRTASIRRAATAA